MSLSIANKRLLLLNPKYVQAKRATTGFTTLDANYGDLGPNCLEIERKNENRSMAAMNFNPNRGKGMRGEIQGPSIVNLDGRPMT